MVAIKVVLILAVAVLALFVLRSHGTTRGGAYVKILMALFMVFAVYAVLRPDDVTWVANRLGVQRGTDLVLYALVVGVAFFAVSTYLRFKEIELRYARLARAIALSEANQHNPARVAARSLRPSAAGSSAAGSSGVEPGASEVSAASFSAPPADGVR